MGRLKYILITAVILILVILYTPLIQTAASPLIVQDPLAKADAIVVLSGGWEKEGRLGKNTIEGYTYGIRLFQKGLGKYLLFSGGNLREKPSEAQELAQMAMANGFPRESILIEDSSESTWEKALFIKKVMLDKNLDSVVLVTSPYHALRAKTLFEEKGIKVISAPVPDGEFYQADGPDRLRIAKLVALEYLKLGLYKLNFTK
ncbi:MAG: YdcF family protein [Thermincola sp.]|jgi:uncharacterized SAM-binding protein YcdF (DUF218 family)|nr:YdcF family protein [Thermincola sp.]MDT3704155.1 YdcF family protein [Thermincola sp.]